MKEIGLSAQSVQCKPYPAKLNSGTQKSKLRRLDIPTKKNDIRTSAAHSPQPSQFVTFLFGHSIDTSP